MPPLGVSRAARRRLSRGAPAPRSPRSYRCRIRPCPAPRVIDSRRDAAASTRPARSAAAPDNHGAATAQSIGPSNLPHTGHTWHRLRRWQLRLGTCPTM
jgi:hypothetical protein